MDNKERNSNPADSGIVTKKGFLIAPPKKIKGVASLEFTSAKTANQAETPKNADKHGKNEQSDKRQHDDRGFKNNHKKNHKNRRRGRNEKDNTAQPSENRVQPNENRGGNQPFKKGAKPFGKNARDNSRDNARDNAHDIVHDNHRKDEKNAHNHKNSDKKNRDNKNEVSSNNKEKRSLGNESILRDIGFVSDSFMKKSKVAEVSDDDTPEQVIDYSKAIPLREQIYGEKPKPEPKKFEGEGCEIIGVRFKEAGKIYYFDPDGKEVSYGTPVIVETARGMEYGYTAIANRFIPVDDIVSPLKKIVRLATTQDKERLDANKVLEKDAEVIFKEKTAKLGLEMELVGVEYTFDNTKLLFYFVAEGRVDFRELVKELAAVFHTRIELRQVGVRDQAKMLGGLGVCGRALCCKSFLGEFAQVSIKMAKDQNLSLNSAKISGTCGRLLCCLRYEDEVYQKEYERTPKVDAIVETPEGKGVVIEANPLKGTVRVLLESKSGTAPQTFHRDNVKIVGYAKKADNTNDEELKELEKE